MFNSSLVEKKIKRDFYNVLKITTKNNSKFQTIVYLKAITKNRDEKYLMDQNMLEIFRGMKNKI